jgi:uncharacterized protein YbjT (DUF2867 family)
VTALRKVVVFGGTGFLGRRVAQHLLDHGVAVRVASRHPYRAGESFRHETSELEFVQTRSVVAAMTGTSGVVNAVSLYLEQGRQTFHSVHVEAARRLVERELFQSGAIASRASYVLPGSGAPFHHKESG